MCELCIGGTLDDLHRGTSRLISAGGWRVISVGGPLPWSYTIGLGDLGTPELVMLGPPGQALRTLDALGAQLRDGLQVGPGESVSVRGRRMLLGGIHPRHVERGLVAWLVDFHEWTGESEFRVRLLQVLTPPGKGLPVLSARRLDGTGNPLRL